MSNTEAGPRPAKDAVRSTQLKTVSFSSLLNGNESAVSELLRAAVQDGFFYLDLRHAVTQPLLDVVENLYKLNETLFSLDEQSLMKYDLDVIGPSKIDGYKPAGRNTGVAAGKKDGFEIYLISTNKLFDLESSDSLPFPDAITHQRHMIESFIEKSHWIGSVIITHLSSALQLNHSVSLQASHRYGKPSTSALGLLKYPAVSQTAVERVGQTAHTDVGSITVLFSQLGGLQVLEQSGEWAFVEPKADHAVINIGDSLRFMAGKAIRSSLHRVVPHPDAWAKARYSVAYFMRPEYDAEFKDEEGVIWTGLEWHTRKFAVFRASVEEQSKDSVLTGRKGYLGLWGDVRNSTI